MFIPKFNAQRNITFISTLHWFSWFIFLNFFIDEKFYMVIGKIVQWPFVCCFDLDYCLHKYIPVSMCR